MGNQNYKLVAPDIERLLKYFDKDFLNSSGVRPALAKAMNPLFDLLEPLEPLDKNNEVKFIWLLIPRGDISDFESFEYLKECDNIKNEYCRINNIKLIRVPYTELNNISLSSLEL